MKIENHVIRNFHAPNKIIYRGKIHQLTNLDKKFLIKGYTIKTVDKKIDSIILNNPHPNANPRTGEFCIPNNLRNNFIDDSTLNMIGCMLCCFNLDDCYFTPWDEIEYKK